MAKPRWPFKNMSDLKIWLEGLRYRVNPPSTPQMLPITLAAVFLVVLAVVSAMWLQGQRAISMENAQAAAALHKAPTQELRPLPDAWQSVIDELYKNDAPARLADDSQKDPQPQYVKNARNLPILAKGTPKIAIVIDDVGVNRKLSVAAEERLPPEVTFAYLPYGEATMELAHQARANGREVMIHLPMEPMPRPEEPPIDPGNDALYVHLTAPEIRDRVQKNLQGLQSIAVGVNNHMGSRFTAYKEGLIPAFELIDQAGLFYLDSLTTHESAVIAAAAQAAPDMPVLVRDIFLDHYLTEEALIDALMRLEEAARRDGSVIAIGHPHRRTVEVLEKWIPTLKHKGIALVPITHVLPQNGDKSALLSPAIQPIEGERNDESFYQPKP